MALSKSLRFEVLRRDGFACTYCGRRPPEVELHIDHVTPAALGGRDEPANLRTACIDCNVGKGSTPPDAQMVAQVEADTQRWTAAMKRAADDAEVEAGGADWFPGLWFTFAPSFAFLPVDAPTAVARLQRQGLPRRVIEEMVCVAAEAKHVPQRARFNYFMGCCRNQLAAIQDRAAEIVATEMEE